MPLAVERVNADSSLLAGHRLRYNWRDSGCSASGALVGLGSLISSDDGISAVIGPACSVGCEPTAYLTAGQVVCACTLAPTHVRMHACTHARTHACMYAESGTNQLFMWRSFIE